MVEGLYQSGHTAIPPPIPMKKPRPASNIDVPYSLPRDFMPQQLSSSHNVGQMDYQAAKPAHGVLQYVPSGGSPYRSQRELPSINTNVSHTQQGHQLNHRSGSTSTSHTARSSSVSSERHRQEAYVATLRKQKETVWCERAQIEDPRIMAAQKAAKMRAVMEVVGSSASSYQNEINHHGVGSSGSGSPASSLYGGVSSSKHNKILVAAAAGVAVATVKKKGWHSGHGHSSNKKIVMDPGSLIVGAVPTRLSASEVMGDSSDDEDGDRHYLSGSESRRGSAKHHRHSSFSSTGRRMSSRGTQSRGNDGSSNGLRHMNSTGSKSSGHSAHYSPAESISEMAELSLHSGGQELRYSDSHHPHSRTYGDSSGAQAVSQSTPRTQPDDYFYSSPPTTKISHSESSSSSGSMAEGLGPLPSFSIEGARTPAAELRRRGSVDEREARTRTMSGVRLFIANPDV